MQTHIEQELAALKELLLTMASHAEGALRAATDGLLNRNEASFDLVKQSEDVIDRLELEVDEAAIQLLAKAPLATNLRLIMVAMKIAQNLERVGDEASKIAKRARELNQEAPLKQVASIPQLNQLTLRQLKHALDAFVNRDANTARAMIPQDKEVDELNKAIYRDLAEQMLASPETISRALNLIVVAKSLERIADHAKNIAEEIVYLCEAEDIRHSARGKAGPPQASPSQG